MAATYSPNLKIELIGAGEQSGVWGDTTNTNLGTTIEQAISGYGTVAVEGDGETELSYSNTNGSQTARCFTLNVTGTLSGSENVVVPTIEKSYIVQNNTNGGYNIVVKTALGSGVTVPNGKSVFVYVDGTNVVEAITHLSSVTFGSALPVVSGGTGASSAADARTNLGVAIGSDVQAYDVDLSAIAALSKTDGNFIVGDGTTWVAEAPATARTSLGLGSLATLNTIDNSNWSGTDLAVANGGTGSGTANGALNNLLPSQTGNSGEYLTTDGTNASWASLPTSHSAVGTYSYAICVNTSSVSAGSTVTGDKLRYNFSGANSIVRDGSNVYNGGGSNYGSSTTWRKMGGGYTYLEVPRPENTTLYYWYAQLWVRVS